MQLCTITKLLTISLLICIANSAVADNITKDTTIKVANKATTISGNRVSTVYLTNYTKKRIGELPTYSYNDAKSIIISMYHASKTEGAYILIIQSLQLKQLKGKTAIATVSKAFVDPEMQTSPKQYFDVVIDIREANNEVANIGETIDIRSNGIKAEQQNYIGINNAIPFATKVQAAAFANKLNKIFNDNY